jgi:hypothetical protein
LQVLVKYRFANKIEIQSLDFFGSFFVKKKRKKNRIISQIEIIIGVINLIGILIGGTKAYTQFLFSCYYIKVSL